MFRNVLTSRLVAALAAGGVLAIAQLSGPATVASVPALEQVADYPESVETTTDVRVDHPMMRPGQTNHARATVSSDNGTPKGTVTFKVSGHAPKVVTLRNGHASYTLPSDLAAGKTYTVTARYNGKGQYKPSSDETQVTVVKGGSGGSGGGGDEGDNGANGGGTGGSGGGAGAPGSGDLPATGSDSNSVVFTLVGMGLLGLGAFSLIGRRRHHA
jgi:LPXTG-motif cell wall-anchored protein